MRVGLVGSSGALSGLLGVAEELRAQLHSFWYTIECYLGSTMMRKGRPRCETEVIVVRLLVRV